MFSSISSNVPRAAVCRLNCIPPLRYDTSCCCGRPTRTTTKTTTTITKTTLSSFVWRTIVCRHGSSNTTGFHQISSSSSFSGTSSLSSSLLLGGDTQHGHSTNETTKEAQRRRQAAIDRHAKAVSRSQPQQPPQQDTTHRSTPNDKDDKSPPHPKDAMDHPVLTCAGLEKIPGFFEPQLLPIYRTLHHVQQRDHPTRDDDTLESRGRGHHVAEIGVYQGRSFLPLVEMVCSSSPQKDELAIAIDCFESQQYNRDSSGEGNYRQLERHLAQYGFDVEHFFRKEHQEGQRPTLWHTQQQQHDKDTTTTTNKARIVALQADSLRLTKQDIVNVIHNVVRTNHNTNSHEDHPDEGTTVPHIRFFSIDGSHTEEAVMSDISLAHSCLSAGGILVLDDALNPDWPGVTSGLSRYLMKQEESVTTTDSSSSLLLYPFAFGYNKCFLSTGDPWNTRYRNALQPYERKQSTFWNCPVSILPQGFIASHFGND